MNNGPSRDQKGRQKRSFRLSKAKRDVYNPRRRQASPLGAGWSSPVARQAHNLKAAGSNPAPATNILVIPRSPARGFWRSWVAIITPCPMNSSKIACRSCNSGFFSPPARSGSPPCEKFQFQTTTRRTPRGSISIGPVLPCAGCINLYLYCCIGWVYIRHFATRRRMLLLELSRF